MLTSRIFQRRHILMVSNSLKSGEAFQELYENKQLPLCCKYVSLFMVPRINQIVVNYNNFGTKSKRNKFVPKLGGGPRVVVSTAAFHARVRGSVPGLGGLKETKMFLLHPRVKVNIVGSLRDREVACSASDRQGSNFESCVWRTVSSHSSHHPQEVVLAQFSLYVHKGGLKPDSFHLFLSQYKTSVFIYCHSRGGGGGVAHKYQSQKSRRRHSGLLI